MRKPFLRVAVVVLSLGAGSALLAQPSALAQHKAGPVSAARLPAERVATGVVYGAGGRPAPGVCVTATGTGGTAFARTAPTGRYLMAVPSTGPYVLRYRMCRTSGAVAIRSVAITGAAATPVPAVTLPRAAGHGAYAAELAAAGVTVPRTPAARIAAPRLARRPGAGIHGKVTSPSGRPLKNICAWIIGKYFAEGMATAKNGTYFIPAQPGLTGRYPVEFVSPCSLPPLANGPWAPQWYKGKFSQSAATKVLLKPGHVVRHIDAVMQPGGEVTGTVTGAAGRKLAGVCVVLTTANGTEVAQAITRATGRYRLVGLDPGRYRALFVGCRAADYMSSWWPSAQKLSGARPIRVRLGQVTRGINARLVQLGTITGTVRLRNKHGRPLRGMCVSADSPNSVLPGGFASTRRNGTYTIPGLAAGRYQIFVNAGCNNNGNYTSATYPRLVSVADGVTVKGVDVYLQPGGIVSGTVTSAATGKPLSGICVADDNGAFGVTSGIGTYRLDQLSAGRTTIGFGGGCGNKASYAPQWYPAQDNPAAATTVMIRAGHDTAGIDAAMLPGATIAGQVTRNGKPAAGVCVSAVDRFDLGFPLGDLGGDVITGRKGDYSIANLAPDDYAVAFFGGCGIGTGDAAQQWYPGQPTYSTAGLVSAQAGETVDGINAAVTPGGFISGNVTDSSGGSLQFSCVYALNSRTGLAGGNDSFGFGGGYTIFGLAPGRYVVEAQDCSGGNLANDRYKSLVSVRAGHNTSNINLKLRPGGSITGKITIRGTNAPARGVCVGAIGTDPLGGGGALTGRDGRYRIVALSPGSYRITVVTTSGCESRGESLAPARVPGRVRVTAGRVTTGVNGSVGQGGSLSGQVTGPGGHAEPGMCVEVLAHPGGFVSGASTDRNGQYLVSGLAPGRYDVLLGDPGCSDGPPGLASQWYDGAASRSSATPVTVTADHIRLGVNAVLGTDGTISGSVTGPASAPLTGICVSAVPVSRSDSTLYTTSSQGTYTLAELPPGRYRVEFRSGCGLSGFKAQWWDASGSKAKAMVITVGPGAVVSNVSAVMKTG